MVARVGMSAHLITSRARARLCSVCAEPVIEGVCEGRTVRVDPYPVPAELEIVAIIAKRETYSFFAQTLVARLGNSPVSGPVLISHRCGLILRVPPPPAPPAEPEAFVPPF